MSSAGAAQILEAVMLVCFGFSWPISLIKNIRVRSARAMSLPFICLIITGYVAGIAAKAVSPNPTRGYVWFFYILNLTMVTCNLVVYFINRRHDRIREGQR